MGNGDAGTPIEFPLLSDRSVQVTGTFGSGGTVVLEGSNDGGTTWTTLKDPFGTALSFTAAGLSQVVEGALQMRPRITAGDGTTDLNVILFMRG